MAEEKPKTLEQIKGRLVIFDEEANWLGEKIKAVILMLSEEEISERQIRVVEQFLDELSRKSESLSTGLTAILDDAEPILEQLRILVKQKKQTAA